MADQLGKVKHDFIRYANCWEDADVLINGLNLKAGEKVLSIGSAGDNSFSLLTLDPEKVIVVDINEVQLNLILLKKAAIIELEYEEFLAFLGFRSSNKRLEFYQKVENSLSSTLKEFWQAHLHDIENGIISCGKFENYFAIFRKYLLPLIHSKRRVGQLFEEKSASEQRIFFEKKWNTWRWRGLFKIFFSKFVMGRLGRDPAFIREVEIPVSTFIINQAAKELASKSCQKNFYLHFIMTGNFGKGLPHYARNENFQKIKSNICRLTVFHGLAEDVFKEESDFSAFNLSNIFEYMNPMLFDQVSSNLINNASENAKFAYWNLMVPRRMSEIHKSVTWADEISKKGHEKDRCFFYSKFIIDKKE